MTPDDDRGDLPPSLRTPHPDRLRDGTAGRDEILARHEAALDAGHAMYVDPTTRYSVFTAAYLWDRGTCCDRGCRHCPWIDRSPT